MPVYPRPPQWVTDALRAGQVIPAHPLALNRERTLDERRQVCLTRYYHAAGAGGIAVGVHSTQFEIRLPQHNLLGPVLQLAAEACRERDQAVRRRTVLIAGICGSIRQAISEARLARDAGYHVGLLSLGAMKNATVDDLILHAQEVAQVIPLMGFYLQPLAGGRVLPYSFWRRFAEIPGVVAVKIAPFNRYQTLDVVRAIAESGRAAEIALYTGNDDNIIVDLLAEQAVPTPEGVVRLHMAGGLLGHWACWTLRAVEQLQLCKSARRSGRVSADLLALAGQVTACNGAFFDAAHQYAGALPGISAVLERQGLLDNHLCLDPSLSLSHGQMAEIERVCGSYPHLSDDEFVRENIGSWLR
jgi:dihydrodipicolinate synthase/N-acetylneuraminate lyase